MSENTNNEMRQLKELRKVYSPPNSALIVTDKVLDADEAGSIYQAPEYQRLRSDKASKQDIFHLRKQALSIEAPDFFATMDSKRSHHVSDAIVDIPLMSKHFYVDFSGLGLFDGFVSSKHFNLNGSILKDCTLSEEDKKKELDEALGEILMGVNMHFMRIAIFAGVDGTDERVKAIWDTAVKSPQCSVMIITEDEDCPLYKSQQAQLGILSEPSLALTACLSYYLTDGLFTPNLKDRLPSRTKVLGYRSLVDILGENVAQYYASSNLPDYIQRSLRETLTNHCALNGISNSNDIEALADFASDVAHGIQMALYHNQKDQKIKENTE